VKDPRQARFLTVASLRWVVRHRAWTRWHLVRYWRFAMWRLRHRHVVTEGFVFLGRGVLLEARPGHGRLVVGRWVHLGDRTRVLAHDGSVRIGDKCVFGADVMVTGYLDIEVGAACLVADDAYVTDFDHRTDRFDLPIKDQGIVKSPVRIGPDCWIGTKAVVLRGVRIGEGTVVGASSVVTRDLPPRCIAAGVPARVVRRRGSAPPKRLVEQTERGRPQREQGVVEPP
jgi:acetyltransferase-like isoleucine patch superfamily enzyme